MRTKMFVIFLDVDIPTSHLLHASDAWVWVSVCSAQNDERKNRGIDSIWTCLCDRGTHFEALQLVNAYMCSTDSLTFMRACVRTLSKTTNCLFSSLTRSQCCRLFRPNKIYWLKQKLCSSTTTKNDKMKTTSLAHRIVLDNFAIENTISAIWSMEMGLASGHSLRLFQSN